jgi:phage terminase large subunit-like protein
VPPFGDIWTLWDLAYSQSSTSDFSVGITVKISKTKDNLYAVDVLDAVYGKWKSSELATQMALFAKKWPESKATLVEKINGLEWLMNEVKNAARYYGVTDMKFAPFEIDNSKNAKRNRIKNLELLMFDNRLHFVSSALWNDECFKQFTMFNGDPSTKSRKDDFPDVVSFVFQILPKDAVKGGNEDPIKTRQQREEATRTATMLAMHERMHGGEWGGTRKNPGTSPQGTTARGHNLDAPPPAPVAEQRPLTPREQALAQMMKILPSRMRYRGN